MKHLSLLLYLSLFFLPSCQPAGTDPAKQVEASQAPNPLPGLWKLQVMEQYDSTSGRWLNYRNGMQGFLLYDDNGHVALHLSTKGYQNFLPEFSNFEDQIPLAALQHLTNSYHYLGKYKLDQEKGIVSHQRLAASNPSDWGEEVRRRYELRADTLVLRPEESSNRNLRLKWIKSKE